MNEQTTLDGRPAVPAGVTLTTDEERTLELVRVAGPVWTDEVGALVHAHPDDTRCERCGPDGRRLLERLADLGLVERTPTVDGGWRAPTPVVAKPEEAVP